ncbi:hypothetical protein MRB53_040768 [Persea americana]|nr:hypothetical protein MRB53_040768 [Persea americana]
MTQVATLEDLWSRSIRSIVATSVDFPFALFYAVVDVTADDTESPASDSYWTIPKKCVLVGTIGIAEDHPEAHKTFSLMEHIQAGPGIVKPCLQAWKSRDATLLTVDDDTLPASLTSPIPGRSFNDPIRAAMVSPVKSPAGSEAAALISLPEEQRRAQKMADEVNNALAQQLRLTTLQAEQSEAKFSRLASTAPTGMFMFDGEGKMVYVNDTYLEMLGFTRDELAFRKADETALSEEVHDHDRERFVESWRRAVEEKTPHQHRISLEEALEVAGQVY